MTCSVLESERLMKSRTGTKPETDLNFPGLLRGFAATLWGYKSMKRILIACEFSGTVRDAFVRRGFDAWSCDLLPSEAPGNHIQGDVLNVLDEGWDLIIGHPPCTHLAISGARHFPEKIADGRQKEAIVFFMALVSAPAKHIAIENPVCIMSSFYRKPDQIIQPYLFGHGEKKATCLWLKNLPALKPTNIVEGREQRIWKIAPGPNRWKERSKTFQGIADAMAEQWGSFILQNRPVYYQMSLL